MLTLFIALIFSCNLTFNSLNRKNSHTDQNCKTLINKDKYVKWAVLCFKQRFLKFSKFWALLMNRRGGGAADGPQQTKEADRCSNKETWRQPEGNNFLFSFHVLLLWKERDYQTSCETTQCSLFYLLTRWGAPAWDPHTVWRPPVNSFIFTSQNMWVSWVLARCVCFGPAGKYYLRERLLSLRGWEEVSGGESSRLSSSRVVSFFILPPPRDAPAACCRHQLCKIWAVISCWQLFFHHTCHLLSFYTVLHPAASRWLNHDIHLFY